MVSFFCFTTEMSPPILGEEETIFNFQQRMGRFQIQGNADVARFTNKLSQSMVINLFAG